MAEVLETSRMRRIKQRLPPPWLQHTRGVTGQGGELTPSHRPN